MICSSWRGFDHAILRWASWCHQSKLTVTPIPPTNATRLRAIPTMWPRGQGHIGSSLVWVRMARICKRWWTHIPMTIGRHGEQWKKKTWIIININNCYNIHNIITNKTLFRHQHLLSQCNTRGVQSEEKASLIELPWVYREPWSLLFIYKYVGKCVHSIHIYIDR